jgi:hypothetical protein
MHSFPVVEGHPVNDLIFGLPPGSEAHAVQAFDLEPNRVSVTALSQQLPLRLIDPRMA